MICSTLYHQIVKQIMKNIIRRLSIKSIKKKKNQKGSVNLPPGFIRIQQGDRFKILQGSGNITIKIPVLVKSKIRKNTPDCNCAL